jgi:hypothetical protein
MAKIVEMFEPAFQMICDAINEDMRENTIGYAQIVEDFKFDLDVLDSIDYKEFLDKVPAYTSRLAKEVGDKVKQGEANDELI